MNQEKNLPNPLGTERIGKLLCRFAVPSVISLVVNSLYNMVDQVFIGQGVGYLGNAATNVIMPLMTIIMALGLMVGDGTASYMSLNLGKGKEKIAAHGVGNAVTVSVIISIICMVLFQSILEPLCWLFGATEDNLPYALAYGRIIILGFPVSTISISFASFIRADGRPNASMKGLLMGCITNMILDPVFIFIFHWGMQGAAIATIIGQAVNAVYFIYCMFHFQTIHLKKEYFIPKAEIIGRVCALGLSSFFTQFASVVVIAVINNALVYYGALSKYGADIPLATLGITMKVSMLASGIAIGIASGAQPIWGFNYGSRKYDRVKKTFQYALSISTVVLVIAFVVFQLFPVQIIDIFGKESDLYVEYAVLCFRIFLGACFMIPFSCVTAIFFQAIGKPALSAVISLLRQVILLIPAVLICGAVGGVVSILFAGAIADGVSGIISIIILIVCWKRIFSQENKKSDSTLDSQEPDRKPSDVR